MGNPAEAIRFAGVEAGVRLAPVPGGDTDYVVNEILGAPSPSTGDAAEV